MKSYLNLLRECYTKGTNLSYRNGDRRTIFNAVINHPLKAEYTDEGLVVHNFPLLTTKRMSLDTVAKELHGFITNDDHFIRTQTGIWSKWAGKIPYGEFWEKQLPSVVKKLQEHLAVGNCDTRCIVTADANMITGNAYALPPCHYGFMFHPLMGRKVGLSFSMRSSDVPIGLPYNIASYTLLLMWICKQLDAIPSFVSYHAHNAHIYADQIPYVELQLNRIPNHSPTLTLFGDTVLDYRLSNYDFYSHIPYPVSA